MTKAAELAKMGEVLTNSQIGGRRNIIVNGAMQVAQRSTSETGKGADAGYFTVDRMYYFENGTTDVRFTQSQSTDVPTGEGFAKSLAAELSPNIRVNVIAPSLTDTPLAIRFLNNDLKKEKVGERHPLKRHGQARDIANSTSFLLSDKS